MHFNYAGYHINQAARRADRSSCVYPLNNLPGSTAGITTALFWCSFSVLARDVVSQLEALESSGLRLRCVFLRPQALFYRLKILK